MNDQLQVIINDTTDFLDSDANITTVIDNTILLEQVPTLHKFHKVQFKATVTHVNDPMSVGKARVMTQEVYVGDATSNCKLQLWDPYINTLDKGKTYLFQNISINEFNGRKYLTVGKDSSFTQSSTIGEVVPSTTNDNEYATQCEIIAVTSFRKTKLCICCKFRMNDNESEMRPIAKCPKCETLQKISACPISVSAKVIVKSNDFEKKTIIFHGSQISKLTKIEDEDNITDEDLLFVEPFAMTYNGDTILSVENDTDD